MDGDIEILKDKKQYSSKAEANTDVRKLNKLEGQLYKMAAYQCSQCKKWHIGTSDNAIPRK